MDELEFEWDTKKAARNTTKHGITFDEAATVFRDGFAMIIDDPDHPEPEQREIILGESEKKRLLVVSFTERPPRLRIISARKATKQERRKYEEKPDEA